MNANFIPTIFSILGDIMNLTAGYFLMKSLDCCLKRRKSRLLFLLGLIGYATVASIIVYPQDMWNITIIVPIFLLLNFALYKGRWTVKISLVLILLPISCAINFLERDIGSHIFFLFFTSENLMANTVISTLSFLPVVFFWALFYFFFGKFFRKIYDTFTDRTWVIIDIVCAASFVGIFSCIYLSPFFASQAVWPCMVACIATNMGIIRLAAYLADGIFADMERKNLQLQKNYYEELERNQNQIRKFRHDMNNHLSVISQFLQKKDIPNALTYFEKMAGSIQSANRKFCENSVVNAVLNSKYQRMTEYGIDVFFNISIDNMVLIDDVSLCTIFANTLDNAIEACRKISQPDKRWLRLKCRYTENGYFSFELENSKENKITMQKGKYISDKEDKRIHGIGISSVKEVTDRYEGTLDISHDQNSFKVVILIG
ncbi:MAG: sensor histidine kinase [Ruminococcus sp.]|jgi:two-component system sensor histidine kinase AgrC